MGSNTRLVVYVGSRPTCSGIFHAAALERVSVVLIVAVAVFLVGHNWIAREPLDVNLESQGRTPLEHGPPILTSLLRACIRQRNRGIVWVVADLARPSLRYGELVRGITELGQVVETKVLDLCSCGNQFEVISRGAPDLGGERFHEAAGKSVIRSEEVEVRWKGRVRILLENVLSLVLG